MRHCKKPKGAQKTWNLAQMSLSILTAPNRDCGWGGYQGKINLFHACPTKSLEFSTNWLSEAHDSYILQSPRKLNERKMVRPSMQEALHRCCKHYYFLLNGFLYTLIFTQCDDIHTYMQIYTHLHKTLKIIYRCTVPMHVFKYNGTPTIILPFFLGDKSAHLCLDSEMSLVCSCLRKNQEI